MAYTVVIGGNQEFPLASSSGWSEAKEWIDGLEPSDEFVRLIQLADYGWTHSPRELSQQIKSALRTNSPSPDVKSTMLDLLASLEGANDESSVFVSDGTSDDRGRGEPWTSGEHDIDEPPTKSLSFDVQKLRVNRSHPVAASDKPPRVPDFDRLGDVAMDYLQPILDRIADAIRHQRPITDLMSQIDLLVAQTWIASQIAGAVGLWQATGAKLKTLNTTTAMKTATRFPWLEDAARWLIEKRVYLPSELGAMADQANAKSKSRWQSVQDITKARDEIQRSFVAGESLDDFIKRVKDTVAATKPMLETAFRTETHQAYIVGATMTLEKPLIRQLFPAVEYQATLDTRVRDTHRHLDGRVFDIGTAAYNVMQRALADYNCRCAIRAMDKKEMSKKKVEPQTLDTLPADVLAKYGA